MACTAPKPAPAQLDGGRATSAARNQLLGAAGECALKTVTAFRGEAKALAEAPSPSRWRSAMATWQRVEVMQFGPTGNSSAPAGLDFRDQIYSWPLVSRCAVDDALVTKSYANGVGGMLVNRRGLAALEYLLTYSGDDVSCGASAWSQLSPEEHVARKQAYTAAAAKDLEARAEALVTAWESGFVETLRTAGPGNTTYPTTQAAMNRLSDAMFYLDREVKDIKLAKPLGLRECASAPCMEALESQYAQHNTANLRANLEGFRQLYDGCGDGFTGFGFDDVLIAEGASSLAGRMHERIMVAQAALDAIEEPDLQQALKDDPASVRAFYEALKDTTDLMKSELVTVLDLELPMGLEGDND